MHSFPARFMPVVALFCLGGTFAWGGEPPYKLTDSALQLVSIDSTDKESFLSVNVDSEGRIFAGAREALFVYEPQADGRYSKRKELYRFPANTWIYDVAFRGNDLYVMTVTTLYLLPGARVKHDDVTAKPLLWGFPSGSHPKPTWGVHQGMHGLAWGPEGDLYFSFGDLAWGVGDYSRPDHWNFIYLYTADGQKMPFNGVGGIARIKPDGTQFRLVADGLRNPCGLEFDSQWNLFTHDNDHESRPALYVPGRLLYATHETDFFWPRGWSLFKSPQRRDLLKTMNESMGRTVPVGQTFYDEPYLPKEYQNNILLARWGQRSVERFAVSPMGATFRGEAEVLLAGKGQARPVGICVGRGGRIFAAVCYMGGNDKSPIYRSDLVMITRADDTKEHPFEPIDLVKADTKTLLKTLASPSRELRHAAHVEALRRRGGDVFSEAGIRLMKWAAANTDPSQRHDLSHLIHLVAAATGSAERPNPLLPPLLEHKSPAIRLQVLRAMYTTGQTGGVEALLDDPDLQVRHHAWLVYTRRGRLDGRAAVAWKADDEIAVRILKQATSNDTYLRQCGVQMIATRFTHGRLAKLCESTNARERLAATMALGRLLTRPRLDFVPPEAMPLIKTCGPQIYVGDKVVDLEKIARIGNYTMDTYWKHVPHTDEQEALFSLLLKQTKDASESVRVHAARYLAVLRDRRSEPQVAKVWASASSAKQARAKPIPIQEAWVLGSFADDEANRSLLEQLTTQPIDLNAKYPSGKSTVLWTQLKADKTGFSLPQDEIASYLYFQLQSSARQVVGIPLHSPGKMLDVMIWRNGKLSASASGHHARGLHSKRNIAQVELLAGTNDILVRVLNISRAPSLQLQLKAAEKVAMQLPSREASSLAERLAEVTTSGEHASIPPEFLKVDWNVAAGKGDAENGRKLFGSIGCAKCHAVSSEFPVSGGPSLAGAGRRFNPDYLVESVLAPSRRINELFQTTTIETTQGNVITGLVLSRTDNQVELLLADTKRVMIKKEEIESERESTISVMPVGLVKTPNELKDIVAYLLQLKDES